MAAESLQSLVSLSELVSTSSTNQRVRIFRREIPAFLNSSTSEMSTELASLLIDIIFRTVAIYDDLRSRKAVDDVIVRALGGTVFMKTFAGALVQNMEKQSKFQSHVGGYRLLSWSCLLLSKSQFAAVSKNALCRVAAAQASLLSLVLRRSFRERKACRKKFLHLFSQSPDIYKVYMEELRNGRIPFKDSPELLMLLLEFSSRSPSLFGEFKPAFLDIYVNAILSAKEKPGKSLTEAFHPLYLQMSHGDFQSLVIPSSVKMLKRNPEIVLESVRILLKSVNLDLSKYAAEILSVVLAQARHADEGRRDGALAIVHSLSQKSSNPDALDTMFNAIKSVIKGSEGRLAFPYQRVGMVNAIQELSNAPDGKYLISLSRTICDFLLSYYKDDGNEEVKIVILSAIASWAVRSTDIIQESLVSFLVSGLKEKETLRKGFLRSLHAICKNEDAILKMLPLFGPLVQLVKTGFTKAVQRLDGMYALLLVVTIAAVDIKAEETLVKEKIWALISQNEPSVVPISMASKLSIEDSMACVDLLEVLLVEHLQRTLSNFSVRLMLQLDLDVLISESDTDISLDPQVLFIPSVEVLVKALLIMSPAALKHAPESFFRIILCSHHPCVVGGAKRDAVWKRLSKCLQTHGFVVIDIISANVGGFLQSEWYLLLHEFVDISATFLLMGENRSFGPGTILVSDEYTPFSGKISDIAAFSGKLVTVLANLTHTTLLRFILCSLYSLNVSNRKNATSSCLVTNHAQTLIRQGHTVLAHSRSDHFLVAQQLGVTFFPNPHDLCKEHPEVILLCSSIISTQRVLLTLPFQHLKCSTLFVEVFSIKEFPKNLLLHALPSDFDVLCTHPMFGPQSAPHAWVDLPFVYEMVRIGANEHPIVHWSNRFGDYGTDFGWGKPAKVLLGPMGLKSANPLEQQAAILSLCNLMSIIPGDTYLEFEKNLLNLPERFAHDTLSENDIQIFHTPEGMLFTEQGVYVAESVTAKNTKQAKGRFRMYDDEDGEDNTRSNHSVKRDQPSREAAGAGKKDTGKAAKKADKGKTAKEEARELLLKEEASVRDRVREIQKNLSLMLRTLGDMAIANSVFAHSRLPSMFVEPLMRSPIVSDEAFETMVKLARCTAPPLCDWALDISTALRLIVTDEVHLLLDLVPSVAEEEANERPHGLFERILDGLSISCKSGALPVDSFSFIFPIIERILLCSKKTKFHDDVLRIFYLHLDPHLPLPRIRMLSVLYHVLGVVPAYQALIGPALNELSLGLQPAEVASALNGVYAKDVHVRMACLNAVKCIPAVANRSLPENVEVATSIWIALHDPEKSVAQVAEDIWDHYGFDFGTDFSGLYKALAHINYNVRVAAAEALAAALDEHPDSIQESLSTLFSLYIRDMGVGDVNVDAGWLGRQGIALALHSAADILGTKDLPVVMTFLISRALADPNADVRGRMINAGILIIDKNGKDNVSLLFPIFENYLNKTAPDEEKYDLVREGVVIFTGALAKHLAKDDPKVHAVVDKLLDVLNTPSEAVQRAVSACLSPLMQSKQDDAAALVSRLMDQMMKSEKYGERRGAAFGLAGLVKGFGISCLKKYRIVITLQESLAERNSAKSREGALLGFECLCETLGRIFEPYVIQMLPLLLVSFSDQVNAVREAAECAARAMMSQLSAQGVKLVLPSLLKGLEDKAWRTKQSSVQLLGAMAYCAPQQLSQCLPKIVPKLTEVLTDTHPKVQSAGQMALQQVGSVIKNPEISALVPTLLKGLSDPNEHTKYSLDILLQTTFVNSIDAPSLALLVPIVHRGLRERSADTKKRAAQIVGNMCSLVTEPKDMIPYIGLLLPEVKKVLVDPIPEVRSVAARAIGSLIGGMGEENFPDLVPWLFDTLKSDNSNVERSGAAQGLSEVLAALGIEFFEHVLPDIIRNCSHQKASVRDGYLTLFKYLPRSLGVQFQNYLPQVLPAILDGLADENESVRDAALGAGHVLVEHYATTSLPLLLPAVEDGIFNDSWRIRQSSVELLGDLLFKVAGTSGKALLEGGSDDEGSSTEAHGRAIIEILGRDKRNEVLAALYMVRADVSLSVRQAALHVWKTIVANTPKTLREIMPVLMDTLITSLASSSSERRQVAGRSLGELVRKLGERVLPLIIPILSQGLNDPNSSRRQGVCVGLSEVMASAGKSQLLTFMNELIPTIRTALCDSVSEVRESAGLAFSTLYKSAGMLAIDEIVPTLLHALEDDETSDTALDGLKQILSVRTSAVLPHILPKLVHPPLSAFNAHALGALAVVAGPGLDFHLCTVLPPLLSAMGDDDKEVQTLAKEAAETVVLVIDEEGIEPLISELVKGVNDSQAAVRRSSSYLIGYFFKNSKLYLVDEAPNMISTLIILLSDSDSSTVTVAWEALSRVIISVPKEVLPSYIKLVRDAVSTSRDKERRKKKGGPVIIPGFCLPKALQPILPIFLQGLISGSAELREQAALGLGELIEVTSEQSLKEFVIPITGPLIRIIGDRFPWQVKSAILSTLTTMIKKGGISLKPFLPQLQTTFVKCLQDSTRTVRSSAALALGKLSGLSTRVDPLVSDLLSSLQGSDGGVREAILTALKGVLKHAGKNLSSAVRTRFYSILKDLIHDDDDRVRTYASSILGILTQYLEDVQLTELIQELSSLANSSSWPPRHGSILTISSLLHYNPATICSSSLFPTIVDCLRDTLKDEKFPLRETSTKALGRLLLYRSQVDPSDTLLYKDVLSLLVSSTHDDSSEVRRRALSAIKAVAKANPSAIMSLGTIVGPALAECMKDGNTPVRLAAERCALHAFQLTKGSENVQAAQKYITGLDARRLSKFPEYSDDSDDSDEDTSSS
ncbi:Translational activator GCN1 [Glycine soja]|nr:Translational activator GCN1 [Glycine soja]